MLPDFPDLKSDLAEHLDEFVRARIDFHLGALSQIKRVRYFEGRGWTLNYSSGETHDSEMQLTEEELSLSVEEIPNLTFDDMLTKLDEFAKRLAEKQAVRAYQRISEIIEKFGNSVDAKGRPLTAELILEMFNQVHIDLINMASHTCHRCMGILN
jgi:hypothetical protein